MKLVIGALLGALVWIQTLTVHAAPGDLDISFAGTGMQRVGFGHSFDNARAVAWTPGGKIVVAGSGQNQSVVLGRFDSNVFLDTTFGDGGRLEIPLGKYVTINTMAIQPDGKIVLGGSTSVAYQNDDYLIIRCNPDGSLDSSFGDGDGIVTTDFAGHDDVCNSIVIQPDGKIVAAGKETAPTINYYDYHLSMCRYNTDGSLDGSFGSGGRIIQTFPSGYNSWANAIVQEGDGNLLIGGFVNAFAVLRYTTNGVLDGSFGSGGVSTCSGYQAQAITIQPSGVTIFDPAKIVAAGTGNGGATVVRMSMSGVLDTTFNGTGVAAIPLTGDLQVTSVAALSNFRTGKKIVIGGYIYQNAHGNHDFITAKLNGDGTPDTTFAGSGIAITDLGGDDVAAGMLVQSGPKLLLVGTTSADYYNADFALVRYNYSDGSFDTNFNGTGILIQDAGNREARAYGTAIQPDGKIVVAGVAYLGDHNVVALCRLDTSGALDPSFGIGGKVTSYIGTADSEADAIAIQPDGKILIAGGASDGIRGDFMVARYLPTGILDPSFGTNGIVLTVVGTNYSSASKIALQVDGKILVGGGGSAGPDADFAVLRYTTNGALDTTWNGTGKVLTGIGPSDDQLSSLKIQADGKIIAAGASVFAGTSAKFSMVRYNTNGTLDSSFGSFGRVANQVGPGNLDASTAMALQPDGKIVLAGYAADSSLDNVDIALARYNSNGTLDPTFDGDGKVTTAIGLGFDLACGVAVQADNKILAGCQTQIGSYYRFGAVRYLSNGSLDPDYGFGGVNFFDFGTSSNDQMATMVLDPAGRAVMVGQIGNIFGIVRVLNSNPAIQITSLKPLPNGHMLLTGVGVPNASHTLQQSPTLSPANFAPLAAVTADSLGNWQFEDATASTLNNRFYRLSFP